MAGKAQGLNILIPIRNKFVRESFFTPDVIDELNLLGTVTWYDGDAPEELNALLKSTDVCITGWHSPRMDESILHGVTRLKLLAHTGGSVAGLASPYLYDMGVRVLSGNKIYAESVAECALTFMLCSRRQVIKCNRAMHEGVWIKHIKNEGLFGKKVGLVGFGAIARHLTNMLKPFRMSVMAYDPFVPDEIFSEYGVQKAEMEEIFSTCDIISLHLAGTDETNGIVTKQHLESIKEGALFINTARANTVDERALEEELMTGRFSAAIDVYHKEPLPADSKLRGLENVLLTPHCGGPTYELRRVVTLELINDIKNFYEGKPLKLEILKEYGFKMSTK